MILKKVKSLVKEFRALQQTNLLQSKEIEWGFIYHDSIRSQEYLSNESFNVGRWAGNYSFFYLLNQVLITYKPKSILEFGLGESSRFISIISENENLNINHRIVEHDLTWISEYKEKHPRAENWNISQLNLAKKKHLGAEYNGYEGIENILSEGFDLYLIDGPFGTKNYSRFDAKLIADNIKSEDSFMILIDDYNRTGEQETVDAIIAELKSKDVPHVLGIYEGNKAQAIIASKDYKFINSL